MKPRMNVHVLWVVLALPLLGIDCNGSDGPDGPPGEGDTLSIGADGAEPTVWTEAADPGAPRGFDPYVDAFFDARGPVPGWAIVLERGIDESGADESLWLWTPAPEAGTYRIATGALRAEHHTRGGVTRSSRRGAEHDGEVTLTRADTRLVGDYRVTLCDATNLTACDPIELAGHFDITRRLAGGLAEDESLPDLEPVLVATRAEVATDETSIDLVIENRGAAASAAASYGIGVYLDIDEDTDGECDGDEIDETSLDVEAIEPGHHSVVHTLRVPSVPEGRVVCVDVEYPGDEEDDQDNEDDIVVHRPAPDLGVEVTSVQHGSGVFVVDYVVRNHGLATLTFEDARHGTVAVDFFANRATPPTTETSVAEATWSITLRPLLLPLGSYAGRSVFFAGDAGGTSGTMYARVRLFDLASDFEPDIDATNDASAPVAWTGSWAGQFVDVGSSSAPVAIGTAPVAVFGTARNESFYAVNVTPGTRVRLRARGMNDPFGVDDWVPRFDLRRQPDGDQLGFSTQIDHSTDPWHELEVDVPAGVGTIYVWAHVRGSTGPLEGSSFFLEILPGGGDLEIDTPAEAELESNILTLPYTITNRGTGVIAASAIPVFFFSSSSEDDPLPTVLDTPQAEFSDALILPGGQLAPGASVDGVARLDFNRIPWFIGELYAVVNGGALRRGCPTCLVPLIDEADLSNNTSAPSHFAAPIHDLYVVGVEVNAWTAPGGFERIVFQVNVALEAGSEELYEPFGMSFRAGSEAVTERTVFAQDDTEVITTSGRVFTFVRDREVVGSSGTLRVVLDSEEEIHQGPDGRENDVFEMAWALPDAP